MKKSNVKKLFAGLSAACVIASALPTVSFAAETSSDVVYGDANCDGSVSMADAVLIMQSIASPSKYGTNGTNEQHITLKGQNNADVSNRGDGVTNKDALAIQKNLLGLTELPESFMEGASSTTTTSTTTTTTTTTSSTDPVAAITYIHLKGSSITVDGDNAAVSGTTVTISHSGTYMIDGTLDDGQINVNIPDEAADAETVKLYLNGVNITGRSAPAILVTNAKNTSINLVDGSENTISDGDTAYAGDNLGAAVIEAKDDLTIKGGDLGTGVLNLTANTQDGISCNNDIKITGGVVNVTTLNATDKTDAIKGKTSVTVKDGKITVDAEGDGIKSSKGSVAVSGGTTSIKAGNDAVQAETTIDISGG
ncbi:MAG: carbohydrate-binding domain-containing protein, partial [Ruminococcus sp.]|nr:carbohydrate-binding domain-containing protein [Ruminococcus sp.]